MNGERVDVADDGAIQITEGNKVLVDSIKRRLDKTIPPSTPPECSIYRVPKKIRVINSYAYTPSYWTSIGPLHHVKCNSFEDDDEFKDHKSRYARELLSRNTPMGTNMLEECVACVKRMEDEVRKCYSEPIELSSDEFVELMVIDGLFMIELFRKYAHVAEIERDDPIFRDEWCLKLAACDLVLLENQIPMVVLHCLFKVLALKKELKDVTLNILALQFLDKLMPRGEEVIRTSFSGCEGKHILDLLHKTYIHNLPEIGNGKKNSWISIPSLTELKRVGVKFVVGSTNASFLDIKFKDGVMEIPPIVLGPLTGILLRNLIAYEQCCDGDVDYTTSYGFLMDSLIKSGKDVRILRKHGIVTYKVGDDDKDFASFFNSLCSEVQLTNFYYSELCKKINSYYEARKNACGVNLHTILLKLLKVIPGFHDQLC